jgi:hypothetical protein
MSFSQSGLLTAEDYDRLAWEYYQTLPLEHFMAATPHATSARLRCWTIASSASRGRSRSKRGNCVN